MFGGAEGLTYKWVINVLNAPTRAYCTRTKLCCEYCQQDSFFKAWVAWTESDVTPDKLINSLMTVMWLFYLIENTDIVLWI